MAIQTIAALERCAKCGKSIDQRATPFILNDEIVCPACYGKASTPVPPPIRDASPVVAAVRHVGLNRPTVLMAVWRCAVLLILIVWFGVYCFIEKGRRINGWKAQELILQIANDRSSLRLWDDDKPEHANLAASARRDLEKHRALLEECETSLFAVDEK